MRLLTLYHGIRYQTNINRGISVENNKDLLDLCRLNQLESSALKTDQIDTEATLKAIGWKKKQLVKKIVGLGEKP